MSKLPHAPKSLVSQVSSARTFDTHHVSKPQFDLSDIVVLETKVRVTNGVRPFNSEIAPSMLSLVEIVDEANYI
jgi:hypothetical protein